MQTHVHMECSLTGDCAVSVANYNPQQLFQGSVHSIGACSEPPRWPSLGLGRGKGGANASHLSSRRPASLAAIQGQLQHRTIFCLFLTPNLCVVLCPSCAPRAP